MDNSSATVMLGLEGMAVLAVSERDGEMEYAIQTTASTGWCPVCGAQARLHGRRPTWVRDLHLSIGGHPPSEGPQRREVFAVLNPSGPAIVVTDCDGDIGWDTLEKVAHPIAAVAGVSEIGSVIFEAIVRLKRT